MTPEECERAVCGIVADLGLWVVLENFLREPKIEIKRNAESFRFQDGALAERIWFSQAQPNVSIADMQPLFSPGKLGWVMLYPSRVENGVLLMAHLGAKSDWLDLEQRRIYENPESIRLFGRMANRLRKHLLFSARNRWTGDIEWLPARVRHSVGVAEWVRSGGKINQWGVGNIDYTIDAAAEQALSEP